MLDGLANVATIDCNSEETLCSKFDSSPGVMWFPARKLEKKSQINIESMDAQEISKKVIEYLDELPMIEPESLQRLLGESSRRNGILYSSHFIFGFKNV